MENKIAIFLPSMRGGGAERQMRNLAEGFAARNVAVDLVLANAEGPYLKTISDSVNIVDLGASRVVYSLPGLVSYLRREQPEAMLAAMSHTNIIAIIACRLARCSTRLVVSERNTPSLKKLNAATKRDRFLPRLMCLFYPWADAIVAVSGGVKSDLESHVGIKSPAIQVIYNPVVSPALYKKAQQNVAHPWFEDHRKVVLAVGRLNKQKDYPTLIQAFAKVYKKAADIRLIILGDGEERQHLQNLIDDTGLSDVVELPGFAENPYACMKRAAVFVLSSKWEGLPGVLIEALALGTPVVATDCPSGPGEILQSGKYGKLVNVGDVDGIAEGIISQLENPDFYEKMDLAPFQSEYAISRYLDILIQ
jgi:glycosyltransferase involved in cell wall biosynthesis